MFFTTLVNCLFNFVRTHNLPPIKEEVDNDIIDDEIESLEAKYRDISRECSKHLEKLAAIMKQKKVFELVVGYASFVCMLQPLFQIPEIQEVMHVDINTVRTFQIIIKQSNPAILY
jgi:hypothetical protein